MINPRQIRNRQSVAITKVAGWRTHLVAIFFLVGRLLTAAAAVDKEARGYEVVKGTVSVIVLQAQCSFVISSK